MDIKQVSVDQKGEMRVAGTVPVGAVTQFAADENFVYTVLVDPPALIAFAMK